MSRDHSVTSGVFCEGSDSEVFAFVDDEYRPVNLRSQLSPTSHVIIGAHQAESDIQ